ncbi:MAG: NUDIX domain-containing protein [Candidatus Pacebacteria bacterium]|nr:NUDIX domain-containing protein [Candidatus Paceibacterota bacterium]
MILDESYGVIVILKGEEDKFLLLKQTNGHWSFPKGHKEGEESDIDTAFRELEEEAGISAVELIKDKNFVHSYEYLAEGNNIHKTNKYFIGFVKDDKVLIQEKEITDHKWVTYKEALETFTYENQKEFISEVKKFLEEYVKI